MITKKRNNFPKEEQFKILKKLKQDLLDNKAADYLILDLEKKSDIANFFVIIEGASSIHLNMLIGIVKKEMEKFGILQLRREGILKESRWLIIDYGFVLFHLMTKDLWKIYDIESLWQKEINNIDFNEKK
ncbi:MAG: ribosome silencing factor [Elusimicrobiota bacterium]|nr:ribosome silencing factor [Elusimicrobiota bacterium]